MPGANVVGGKAKRDRRDRPVGKVDTPLVQRPPQEFLAGRSILGPRIGVVRPKIEVIEDLRRHADLKPVGFPQA